MTDDRRPSPATAVDAQIERDHAGRDAIRTRRASAQPTPREALDAQERVIRDAVLRMGSLVEAAIRAAPAGRSIAHDAALALDVIKGDTRDQRGPARASRASSRSRSRPSSRSRATCATC